MKTFLGGLSVLMLATAMPVLGSSPPPSCVRVLAPLGGGAYVQTGDRVSGYLLAGNTVVDYFGGGPKEYRNWFVFQVPAFAEPLVGAELRLATGTTISESGSEAWELHDVTTPPSELLTPRQIIGPGGFPIVPPSPSIFADLGDGPAFGSAVITTNGNSRIYYDPGAPVRVILNMDGLIALTARQGGQFAVGGKVTTQDGNTNTPDLVFYQNILGSTPVELVLTFGEGAPVVPVPRARGGINALRNEPTTNLLAGDSLILSGDSCGAAPQTYQWLRNGQPIAGANAPVYYQSSVTTVGLANYQLWASNAWGAVTSPPVTLPMVGLQVYQDLQPTTLMEGDNGALSFSVGSLVPLTFEWRRNGVVVPGQKDYYLYFYEATEGIAGQYQAIARNIYGSVTSSIVQVSVQLRPVSITFQPLDGVFAAGTSSYLSVGAYGHLPIFYQWRRSGVPLPGETNSVLVWPSIQFSDAGAYSVIVSNSINSVTSRSATVNVRAFTGVSGPTDLSVYWGGSGAFWADAGGAQPQSIQWYANGLPVPGGTNNYLTLNPVTPGDAGTYFMVAANSYGAVTSRVARLTVISSEPVISIFLTEYTPTVDNLPRVVAGTPLRIATTVTAGPPAWIQWQRDGVNLPGATNSSLYLPVLRPSDSGNYTVLATNILGAKVSTPITILVTPVPPYAQIWLADYARVPDVEFPQIGAGGHVRFDSLSSGSPPFTQQWLHNEIVIPGATNPSLSVTELKVADSGNYALAVANAFGSVTSAPIAIEIIERAPYFVLVPAVTDVTVGETTLLRSVAGGSPGISYQWRFNHQDLPGATNNILLLTTTNELQSGVYEVVARNAGGESRLTNFVTVHLDTGLDHWRWSLPQPQGSRLKDVTWGNGRYVAVGRAGNVLTSLDGQNWTSVTLPIDVQLETVAWGNGIFLVNGYAYAQTQFTQYFDGSLIGFYGFTGITLTSTDGLQWTAAGTQSSDFFVDVTFGNGVFLARSAFGMGQVYTSTDGRVWAGHPLGTWGPQGIAWGNGFFLASADGNYYRSTNGAQWDLVSTPAFGAGLLSFGNGVFLTPTATWSGSNQVAVVYASPDGVNWEAHISTNYISLMNLAAGGGQFVALAPEQWNEVQKGRLLTSPDLDNWTEIDTAAGQELQSLCYGGGHFVVVGEAGTVVASNDGVTWDLLPVANSIDYYGLATDGRILVAAGDDGTILTSDDGRNWAQRFTPSGRNLHAVAYGNGMFVTTGRRGLIMTSPDGIAWTRRESGVTNYLERVHYANGRWVAVGELGDISTSPDGIVWTGANTGYPFSDHEGITFGHGLWVAAGGYFDYDDDDGQFAVTTIYTSPNAIDWTRQPINVGVRLRDVSFGSDVFVAVGNDKQVMVSSDGLGWISYRIAQRREEDNFRRVHESAGTWVVVGNDGRMISSSSPTDNRSWRDRLSHTSQNLHDVLAMPGGGHLAVGNNGMILRSQEPRPRIVAVRALGAGLQIEFTTGDNDGPWRLESSNDLRTWTTVASGITSPHTIPSRPGVAAFFRIVAP